MRKRINELFDLLDLLVLRDYAVSTRGYQSDQPSFFRTASFLLFGSIALISWPTPG
jgi:hypothetical protein